MSVVRPVYLVDVTSRAPFRVIPEIGRMLDLWVQLRKSCRVRRPDLELALEGNHRNRTNRRVLTLEGGPMVRRGSVFPSNESERLRARTIRD